jgi:hypothetical protein
MKYKERRSQGKQKEKTRNATELRKVMETKRTEENDEKCDKERERGDKGNE